MTTTQYWYLMSRCNFCLGVSSQEIKSTGTSRIYHHMFICQSGCPKYFLTRTVWTIYVVQHLSICQFIQPFCDHISCITPLIFYIIIANHEPWKASVYLLMSVSQAQILQVFSAHISNSFHILIPQTSHYIFQQYDSLLVVQSGDMSTH